MLVSWCLVSGNGDWLARMRTVVVLVSIRQSSNAVLRFTSYGFLLESIKPSIERNRKAALALVFTGAAASVITV